MAYIIAVCGAGGKTTYIHEKAKEYVKQGKSVAITTTTKMWLEDKVYNVNDIKEINKSNIYVVANTDNEHLLPLNKNDYDKLCTLFDIVMIEVDGSKMMPLKIPNIDKEPVVPDNVNEIVVVYGLISINRKLSIVCQRYEDYKDDIYEKLNISHDKDIIVNLDIIKSLYKNYYEKTLFEKYPKAKIKLYISDMSLNDNYKYYKNLALCISASGFSKRFDGNKLLCSINNKKLYKIVINKILDIKKNIIKLLKEKHNYNINIDISVVSQYDEILNDKDYINDVNMIYNENAILGQSESIKIATKKYYDYDAICYFNCDTPNIDSDEITKMIYYFMQSTKSLGAVCVDAKPKNPAIFQKKWFDEIINLFGDTGPKNILNDNIKDCFLYHVEKEMLYDIDVKDDIIKLNNK